MTAKKWFDKKFDFNFGTEQFSLLSERLRNASGIFRETLLSVPEEVLVFQPNGKWSIKENIGHLLILESLWLKRCVEIKNGREKMSPADLNNTATDEANFNDQPLSILLEKFILEREKILEFLDHLKPEDLTNASLHPRLHEPMRILDLMYFVAEHDDHHLFTIKNIIKTFNYEDSEHNSNNILNK